MAGKQERIRVDIWSSLRPVIEAEMQRSGLSAQEVVNVSLVDYFGLTPSGKRISTLPVPATENPTPQNNVPTDEDDYI